jgi:hypothetical protein
VPSDPGSPQEQPQQKRAKRAYRTMVDIRDELHARLVEYVLANKGRLHDEARGDDGYSFLLQQLDEQFLNKLNTVERALCELHQCEHREGQPTTTTYECLEVVARRDELPQKIADALAERSESDFLDMCVLRADDKQAEVVLVMAREDHRAPAPKPARPEKRQQDEQGGAGDESTGGGAES